MTVKRDAANESSRLRNAVAGKKLSERECDRVFCTNLNACKEIETDQESAGSSEDMESPSSVVAKVRRPATAANKNVNLYVHSQILRIREEDSHIGEDMVENLSTAAATDNSKLASDDDHRYHHVDVLIFSHKLVLPASPLSGKMATKSPG